MNTRYSTPQTGYSLPATRYLFALLFSLSLSLLTPSTLHSQWWKGKSPDQVNLFSVGFAADIAIAMHSGSFTLPYAPTCCADYTSTNGFGLALSGFVRQEFTKSLRGTLRLTYSPYNGTFETDENILVTNSTPGTTRHTLDVSMNFVGAELLFDYRVFSDFRIILGGSGGVMTQATYSQSEELLSPGVGTFENGLRTRNKTDNAELQQMSSSILGVVGGVCYDIPMTQNHSVILSPEMLYTVGLSNMVEGVDWKANQVRIGVAIAFALNAPDPPLPIRNRTVEFADSIIVSVAPDVPYRRARGEDRVEIDTVVENDTVLITSRAYRTDTVYTPVKPELTAKLVARAQDANGQLSNLFSVNVSTQYVTEALPLLPVVFFESQSISLSFRYHQVASPREFDVNSIPTRTTSVHRDVLNIIGQRLKEKPGSIISLVGTADPTTEGSDCGLAKSRADEVKKYFVNVWGIEPDRIEVVQRSGNCAPARTTREQSEAGYSENRRVEIETVDLSLLAPVAKRRFNEARAVTPPRIILDPSGTSGKSSVDAQPNSKYITSWRMEGTSGATTLFSQSGNGVPGQITQELTTSTADLMRDNEPIKVRLTIDGIQNTFGSTETTLNVKKDTLKTELERLTLTLFDVSSDEVTPVSEEQIKHFVENVPAGANIIVRGYADMLGNADFNRKLSQKRAQSVCATLHKYLTKKATIDCTEVATDRYPPGIDSYATPEERFLSRTVQIEIRKSR